jgi:hypothetical protein
MKDQFAHARGRIDLFLKTLEMHALAMELGDHRDEMRQRPTEAIQLPHDQGIARA